MAADSPDWRLPARVPADVAAALPAVVRDLAVALHPADPRQLAAVVGALMLHYWSPDRPPAHHGALAAAWIEDLAEYPLAVVAEAAGQWRRAQRWAPTIAELRALCDELLARRRRELLRLRFLAACVVRHGGRVPAVGRRIGDRLVDYGDRATDRDAEAWLRGEHELGCDRVWGLPDADAPEAQP